MGKRYLLVVAAVLACVLVWAAPQLSILLPGSRTIGDWVIYAAADRGAYTEKGLYDLYDGDVPHLKKFGLKAAHQRVYKSGDKRLIVDLLLLDSSQHAKAPYRERIAGLTKLPGCKTPLSGVKEQGLLVPSGGVTIVYFWQKTYLCSISVFGTTSTQQQTAVTFARWISNKIRTSG